MPSLAELPYGAAAPGWEWILCVGLFFAFVGAGISVMVYLARHLDEPDDDDDRDNGGGGGRRPDPPGPRSSPEPDWWPEFERQFASYLQSRHVPTR